MALAGVVSRVVESTQLRSLSLYRAQPAVLPKRDLEQAGKKGLGNMSSCWSAGRQLWPQLLPTGGTSFIKTFAARRCATGDRVGGAGPQAAVFARSGAATACWPREERPMANPPPSRPGWQAKARSAPARCYERGRIPGARQAGDLSGSIGPRWNWDPHRRERLAHPCDGVELVALRAVCSWSRGHFFSRVAAGNGEFVSHLVKFKAGCSVPSSPVVVNPN